MDGSERAKLYAELIGDKIRCNEAGVMEIPLDGMREFHAAACSGSEDLSPLEFKLWHGDEEIFNYYVGGGSNLDAAYTMLAEVYFYDDTEKYTDKVSAVGSRTQDALYRDFCSGVDRVSGLMGIDYLGQLIVRVAHRDCFEAVFYIDLTTNPGDPSKGYQFIYEDEHKSYRIWSDGNKLYVSEEVLYFVDGLSSL